MPRVSVIVVAYNAGPSLPRCLRSIAAQTEEDVQLIVVNNGEAGLEIEEARSLGGEVVTPGSNIGFAAGCNVGAGRARGDVLVFLNPDTVVAPGALAALVRALGDPSVGIAMARLRLLAEPELLNSSGNVLHLTGLGWAGGYREPADRVTESRDVAYASGAAMAMRAEVFRALGGFREELFVYHEDLDLGWRARMQGFRVVVAPEADVFHDYEYARNPRKSYFLERNRLVFLFSAYSSRLLLVLAPVLLTAELALCARALREQWLGEKLAGWAWCARNGRRLLELRRETQRGRRVSDRELAPFLTPVIDPGIVPVSRVLRAANPLLARYWALARRVL